MTDLKHLGSFCKLFNINEAFLRCSSAVRWCSCWLPHGKLGSGVAGKLPESRRPFTTFQFLFFFVFIMRCIRSFHGDEKNQILHRFGCLLCCFSDLLTLGSSPKAPWPRLLVCLPVCLTFGLSARLSALPPFLLLLLCIDREAAGFGLPKVNK